MFGGGLASPQVHISETATDRVANTSPTAASMSTDLYGMAALDACEQITERLKPVAAGLPEGSSFASIVTVSDVGFVAVVRFESASLPRVCDFLEVRSQAVLGQGVPATWLAPLRR